MLVPVVSLFAMIVYLISARFEFELLWEFIFANLKFNITFNFL